VRLAESAGRIGGAAVDPDTARGRAANPLLQGLFVPEDEGDETVSGDLQVDGELPTWLRGQLLHPVAGRWHINGERFQGVFDCQAMVQGLSIEPAGRCSYRRRHLDSENLRRHLSRGQVAARELHSRPQLPSAWDRLAFALSEPAMGQNAWQMLNSFGAGRLMASMNGSQFMEVDPCSFATLGPLRYTDSLEEDGQFFYHAEPTEDARTGEVICASLRFSMTRLRFELVLYCFDAGQRPEPGAPVHRRQLAVVPWGGPLLPLLHTTWITEHYLICVASPAKLDVGRAMWNELEWVASGRFTGEGRMIWQRGDGTTAYVISRESGEVAGTFPLGEDILAGHVANVFERPGPEPGDVELVFDWPANSSMGAGRGSDPFELPLGADDAAEVFWSFEEMTYRRVTICLASGDVTMSAPRFAERVSHTIVNPKVSMRRHRFSYALSVFGYERHRLFKLDHETRERTEWAPKLGEALKSETVFVPEPGSDREDAGVLLTWATDMSSLTSRVVVVDAATMRELASIRLPESQYCPVTLHGMFLHAS